MIMWSENPSCATDFYMPKNMFLENCDQSAAFIFQCLTSRNDDLKPFSTNEIKFQQNRAWYSCSDFLIPSQFHLNEKLRTSGQEKENFTKESEYGLNPFFKEEEGKQSLRNSDKIVNSGQDHKIGKKESSQNKGQDNSLEKQISLVNDSYLSDDESQSSKIKEMIVGDMKVQVDLDLNSVKVPSKWDSDYENENFEKLTMSGKEVDMEIASLDENVSIYSVATAEKSFTNEFLNNAEFAVSENFLRKKNSENTNLKNEKGDTVSQKPVDAKTESLASEYEEFLKMVSFEAAYNTPFSANEKLGADLMKSDKQKNIKSLNSEKDLKKEKLENTDWDKDSDHEEISTSKISKNIIESNNFLTANEEKPVSFKKEVKKELASKKKIKTRKSKQLKKRSKTKKRKYSSSSSDSSSDSYDSESYSESDEKKFSKKKKKKVSRSQKKSRKYSSSESDSDSDSSVSSKGDLKKKSAEKKKKNRYSGDDKTQSVLLKELDFKKQLIMKKIEAIDSISEKNEKKKEKKKNPKNMENSTDDDSDSESKGLKLEKKKMGFSKSTASAKKLKDVSKTWNDNIDFTAEKSSSSCSDSDSENLTSKFKKKKTKKTEKRKRNTSESSMSEEKLESSKIIQNKVDKLVKVRKLIDLDKGTKKMKKPKKQKKKNYSSSESEGYSSKSRKKLKKSRKKITISKEMEKEKLGETAWQDNFLFETEFKTENNMACWDDTKLRENDSSKKYTNFNISKEKNDWEANSSFDESAPDNKEGNSSWDDEIPAKKIRENQNTKEKEDSRGASNFSDFKINPCEDTLGKEAEAFRQEVPVISKSSVSNFSFSENSFNSFEQDFSRNFLLHEPSFSNSAQFGDSKNFENCTIEARPFQSISKPNLVPVHSKSELYSPGHSDSELSDSELHIKTEKINKDSHTSNISRDDIYDPLNSESESSQKNMEIELSNIPLHSVSEILLPGERRNEDKNLASCVKFHDEAEGIELKSSKTQKYNSNKLLIQQDEPKSTDFPSVQYGLLKTEDKISMKKQIISMKPLQKLKSKAASVFQDESDEEIIEAADKVLGSNTSQNEAVEKNFVKSKIIDKETVKISDVGREEESERNLREERKPKKNLENDGRTNSQDSKDKEIVVRSSEKKAHLLATKNNTQAISPILRSKTPELKFSSSKSAQQEIKSDCFEIEPLESNIDCKEEVETLQTIPVLTGLGIPSGEGHSWTRSHLPGYTCPDFTNERIYMSNSESFDIYPSEDSKYRDSVFEDCNEPYENLGDNSNIEKYSQKTEKSKREKKKSRSRSLSPRKKRRSRSPDRRRSPKRKKFRNESPYSPRKRSPKRKSPSRWHRNSRSPDRRRKSRSRSPRKRRSSSFRRSRSFSPRKHRSPKRRGDSPRRRDSQARDCRESISPRKDFSHLYSDSSLQNRIPVIGTSGENDDVKLGSSTMRGSPTGFSRHLADSAIAESDVSNSFYNREYLNEFGVSNYPCEVGLNNLITVKNHEFEKGNSPERLSLDQRIELELGVQLNTGSQCQNEHYQMQNQVPFSDINSAHFPNSYSCDSNNSNNENFYQNQNIGLNSEFNGQFFNGHQQPLSYGSFQQFSNSQPIQNSVLQVGNIVEVVPTMQQHQSIPPPAKSHQIMQVGNVLQVVPSQKAGQGSPDSYGHPSNTSPIPPVKTQKATAVVAPSSIVPPPNPETIMNPLIKAIQLEREKRKKEKEKRKAEREARRKARQLRREAKLMSVNEKLKKSVQDEGLMLGQEVEDDELLDVLDLPTSPIPVEIITVSSPSTLPPAGKGILITAGFMQKPPSEKKEVKFADGVCPGEGTSTSGGEDIVSPPPKPKLPKEKRYRKKKTKVKKKVKVQIIRQIIQEDDDDDDLSPPPPPPGDPPPVFLQVYHTQQTTTTLTTIQYPTPAFQ